MTVGAIDIGTNSVRLLVAEPTDDGGLTDVVRLQTVTALGHGVDEAGLLATDAIERTVAALATYGAAMQAHGVERRRAVATSACRDAANVDAFFNPSEEVLGFRPEVISGEEEAMRSFLGATNALDDAGHAVVIDTGGGSTEFAGADGGVSVNIGSIRLTERCLPDQPATVVQLDAARTEAARVIASRNLPDGRSAIGVAGTWTSLSAMHLDLAAYDSDAVHGSVLMLDDVRHLVNWLSTLSLDQKWAIPSLDPKRAPVILGGAVVAEATLQALALDRITISEHDILDGVAMGLIDA
jgi:exopolyphosphatase/guanosine-5'-triphosphate,3'-diphosphate pyrophosphatase